MINDEANEAIEELFKSLRNRYQNKLEQMKGSEFVFDYVHFIYVHQKKMIGKKSENVIIALSVLYVKK